MKRVLAGVPAVVAAAVLLAAPAASAASATPGDAAGWAARWVAGRIGPDGHVPALSGADHNATALAVLGLSAAGTGEAQAAAATAYLAAHVDDFVAGSDGDKPAPLATLVLVAHARGLDPRAFGGTTPQHDLVARLLATRQASGPDAGLFGAQDATYDGAYRQSLALLALAAAGTTDAAAVAWLKAEQCADGGWMGNRPDQAAPCPAFDFDTFVGVDSNSTALAAQALAALGETPAVDPLDYLADTQNEDGGWGFVAGFGTDANSTALALQALLARGADPAEWDSPGGTPYDALLGLQLGCADPAASRGALRFTADGARTPNLLATLQALPALAGRAYPVPPRSATPGLPAAMACPPASAGTPSTGPDRDADPEPVPASDGAPATPDGGATPRPRSVPTLPETGAPLAPPWDLTGLTVTGLGLIGYGLLALAGSRLARRRA